MRVGTLGLFSSLHTAMFGFWHAVFETLVNLGLRNLVRQQTGGQALVREMLQLPFHHFDHFSVLKDRVSYPIEVW
jgi:hypothetical protein